MSDEKEEETSMVSAEWSQIREPTKKAEEAKSGTVSLDCYKNLLAKCIEMDDAISQLKREAFEQEDRVFILQRDVRKQKKAKKELKRALFTARGREEALNGVIDKLIQEMNSRDY